MWAVQSNHAWLASDLGCVKEEALASASAECDLCVQCDAACVYRIFTYLKMDPLKINRGLLQYPGLIFYFQINLVSVRYYRIVDYQIGASYFNYSFSIDDHNTFRCTWSLLTHMEMSIIEFDLTNRTLSGYFPVPGIMVVKYVICNIGNRKEYC